MNINEIDFYDLCLDEGNPFYGEIYPLDKNLFNEWVRANLHEIGQIESFDDVVPSEQILEELNELGYKHINYQCHYSAKAVTILKQDLRYFTGFVERYSYMYPIITHSYNYKDGRIIDFARINNPEYPIHDENRALPHTYYGIEIPHDFVINYQKETLEENSMKPLLYEWYLKNNE